MVEDGATRNGLTTHAAAPFAAGRDMPGLREAFGLALRLGWVSRAVNAHSPGVDPGPTRTATRTWRPPHVPRRGPVGPARVSRLPR